jgi:cbb3-type cytochrome oxidase subunit 3
MGRVRQLLLLLLLLFFRICTLVIFNKKNKFSNSREFRII